MLFESFFQKIIYTITHQNVMYCWKRELNYKRFQKDLTALNCKKSFVVKSLFIALSFMELFGMIYIFFVVESYRYFQTLCVWLYTLAALASSFPTSRLLRPVFEKNAYVTTFQAQYWLINNRFCLFLHQSKEKQVLHFISLS